MQTLNNFFNTGTESTEWVNGITKSPQFAQVKERMAQDLSGFQLPSAFYNMLIMRLSKALNLDIGEILVWGWRKQREISSYRDVDNPPEGSHKVPLAEHALVSRHSPTFQAKINGATLPGIKLDIVLKLKMKGAILVIRDGKIMQVLTGTCTGDGSVSYAGLTILERKTAPFTLPGSITFDQGIPI